VPKFDEISIYQLSGITNTDYQIPPFGDPQHSASVILLTGGGAKPKVW